LREARYRLDAKASLDWVADTDILGLHRIGSWGAHTEPITSMSMVNDPPTVLTSAMDRLVKLWSPLGDLRGVLRQKKDPDTPWKFRANRRAQEDRKIRAAEQVVLETESSPNNNSTVTNNTASKDDETERPLPSSRSRDGRINATDMTAVAFGSAPSNSHKTPTLPLEKHHD
ncbi:unnamed protein product, partial [Ectocarpus sp. 12 AP-2014]